MEPVFRKKQNQDIVLLADTVEAQAVSRERREKAYAKADSVPKVKADAEAAVRRLGGDVSKRVHLLGQFKIQFGQFRNQTFQWIVSNSLGYAAYLVVSTEKDPASGDARWTNKMALRNYLNLFPEGQQAIELKRKEMRVPSKGSTGILTNADLSSLQAIDSFLT